MVSQQQALTPEMLQQIEAAIQEIVERSGWGRVTIVVEKGRPAKLEMPIISVWLGRGVVSTNDSH